MNQGYGLLISGRSHLQNVDEPFRKVAEQLAEIEANKHRSRLVDPSELPRKERAPPKVGRPSEGPVYFYMYTLY